MLNAHCKGGCDLKPLYRYLPHDIMIRHLNDCKNFDLCTVSRYIRHSLLLNHEKYCAIKSRNNCNECILLQNYIQRRNDEMYKLEKHR